MSGKMLQTNQSDLENQQNCLLHIGMHNNCHDTHDFNIYTPPLVVK